MKKSYNPGPILNRKAKTASLDGETLALTKKEFQILDLLMHSADSYFRGDKSSTVFGETNLTYWKEP